MIDIKDLAGLSEPIKRLIEVISEGIGAISHPYLTKANANAKAYEIRTIAQAFSENDKFPGKMKYEVGNLLIESTLHQEILPAPENAIEKRIIMRVAYQQAKKQSNIECIVYHAAEELKSEQEVTHEKPDSDWITRFFDISEYISSDHMQILWGKILAGEIKRPGSYSLRTLELLKNMNQLEAELFVKVGKIAIATSNTVFIPNPDDGKYLEEKFGLSFIDLLVLREIGLLVLTDLQFQITPNSESSQIIFKSGRTCIVLYLAKDTPLLGLKCILFTDIGKQLFQLIEQSSLADSEYIKKFAGFWRREGVEIKSGIIVEQKGNSIKFENLQEVTE